MCLIRTLHAPVQKDELPVSLWLCALLLSLLCYNEVHLQMRQCADVHICSFCFQVMRNACAGIGSSASGVGNGSVGSKEMHYVLRVLGPAACRCPSFFSNVAKNSLQIALPPQNKILRGEMDPMLPLIGLSVCVSFFFICITSWREILPNYSVTLQSSLLQLRELRLVCL